MRSIKQLILEDYIEARGVSEIGWRAILEETRVRCGGYNLGDIARMVARELSKEGVKIWR